MKCCYNKNRRTIQKDTKKMEKNLIVPTLLTKSPVLDDPYISALATSEYKEVLDMSYSLLDTDALYTSHMHGVGHIERTMLLGALLSYHNKIDKRMSVLLQNACSYHDIGRINDYLDDLHGQRSAKMLEEECYRKNLFMLDSPEDETLIRAAIAAHSLSDNKMSENAKAFGVENNEDYYTLAKLLKDADGLDRVRLGDLDTKYLRTPNALLLKETAQFVYDAYIKEEASRLAM